MELRRGQLLRGRFKEGEELFGFVHEVGIPFLSSSSSPPPSLQVGEKNVSVHLSPRALGHVPLMLAHTDHTVRAYSRAACESCDCHVILRCCGT